MIIGLLLLCNILFSAQAEFNKCQKVASTKLSQLGKTNIYTLDKSEPIIYQDMMLGYVFELSPQGYIVISADDNLPPVIAYSFTSNFYDEESGNTLLELIRSDISLRLDNLSLIPETMISSRKADWNNLLSEEGRLDRPEQWPPEGSTPTGRLAAGNLDSICTL